MNSFEINKIMAAVLVAGITFMVSGVVGGILVHPHQLAKPAIRIEIAPPPGATPAPAAPTLEPIAPLMAAANAENGGRIARQQCGACHNFVQGGPNGVGPNLYGVLGGPHAHAPGFAYSAVIAGMKDKPWTYDDLNAFIAAPRTYAPGTRMGFAGLASATQRADVIAYLRSLDATPKPLPEVVATPVAAAPTPPAASGPAPIGVRLASADPAAGEARAKVLCAACHTFTEGGRAGVGPNLWNVVGGPHAHMEGFNYSAGLAAMKDKPWSFEELDRWLTNPMAYSPGTRMPIATPDPVMRANIIAWLRTLSANPQPLPGAAALPAAAPAATQLAAAPPAPAPVAAAPAAPAVAAPAAPPAPPPAVVAALPPPAAPAAAPPPAGTSGSGVLALLANADAQAGKAYASGLCAACHNFAKDGPNMVGPNLWDVVGRPQASHAGFNYSATLKAKGGAWNYETLDTWLENPMGYAPGTAMVIPTPDPQLRANVIAWLRTLSDNPKPLP